MNIVDYIGAPASFEMLAEEATELAFACLKYARLLRDENPVTNGTNGDLLLSNVEEELGDIMVVANGLKETSIISDYNIQQWMEKKEVRMKDRLDPTRW